jgi:hypothetical protein
MHPYRRIIRAVLAFVPLLVLSAPIRGDTQWSLLTSPQNAFDAWILCNGQPALQIRNIGWAPHWGWIPGPRAIADSADGKLDCHAMITVDSKLGNLIDLSLHAEQLSERSIRCQYQLSSMRDVPLTMLAVAFAIPQKGLSGVTATMADGAADGGAGGAADGTTVGATGGTTKAIPVPLVRSATLASVSKLVFDAGDLGEVRCTIDPPCSVQPENGELRVMLASVLFPRGTRATTITFDFPSAVTLAANAARQKQFVKSIADPSWFAFVPRFAAMPNYLGMEDWMDKPSGAHGGVRMVGDHFEFEDGTHIKFWGTNLANSGCAPAPKDAQLTAERFAHFGINAVRLHKFCGPSGWEGISDRVDATKFDPAGLDRFDYFCSQLKANGVYYGFSHTYRFVIGPGNKNQLLAYDEIAKLKGDTYGLINFAPDVQDLLIARVVNLLTHKNRFTGKAYWEDPSLAFLEIQNEDDIFFFTTPAALQACPTYRKQLEVRFGDWLKAKYGSRDRLLDAWGSALKSGESLEGGGIAVQGNPWFMSEDGLRKQGNAWHRLLDNAAFLHDVQNQFYAKFERAIRATGYKGPMIGSPWQAPAMLPHYYNLRSDNLVGYIDRHNYFGGKIFDSMLASPGSGYLGTGLQQVIDRPFGISEWCHVYPSLYAAEGPPIVAAYGLGLQGWDASYEFTSASNQQFAPIVGRQPFGVWQVDVPTQIGQFPVLARMIARGDVKESDVISVRHISPMALQTGEFSFSDKIEQSGDVKVFSGSVPPGALAIGRLGVQFDQDEQQTTFPDVAKYTSDGILHSTTGQLAWNTSGQGFITIDTPGTKGVVGFAGATMQNLQGLKIALHSPFASLLLTARERGETLATAKTALISVVARAANTGFEYLSVNQQILDNGRPPMLLEPVSATLTFTGRTIDRVDVLDNSGYPTGTTLDAPNGTLAIDGARDKTIYYLVSFR